MQRGMQLPVILSGRENDLKDSQATWSHIIDFKPSSYEEQVAPPVVRQVAPPSTISEGARGSQPLGSSREKQPPKTVHRRSDFRGSQQVQREQMALEIVQTQRESSFRGTCGVSLISERVSWLRGRVDHSEGVPPQVQVGHLPGLTDRCQEVDRRRQEASRRCETSWEDPLVSVGFLQ
jgi:hypothetical protein